MPTLILTRAEVGRLLDLDSCITAVEEAFRQHADGSALPPAMLAVHTSGGAFHVKAAGVRSPTPYFAAKINGNFTGNRDRTGLPTIQGVVVLADLTNGTPLAVMDSIEITMQRTGAATAVAARYLARRGPSVVAIVGCGQQGRVQLRSIAAVREIAEVHVCDISPEAARRFALEMAPVVGRPVHPATSVRRATAAADIVVTCTTSRTPLLNAGDLKPGAFVAAVGADSPEKQEIDPALLASTKVVVDVLEQSATIGDLRHAIEAGAMTRERVHAELGQIVIGRKPGRVSDDEIFVFDSTGMAVQDVAAAALVYERARDRGVGRRIGLSEPPAARAARLSRLFAGRRL